MIAVLFARRDSIYKSMPGCDVWDIDRDARLWPGGCPIVAHPPCRAWGALKAFAKPRPDEKDLARWAVAQVRQHGGVMEHPRYSSLWRDQGMSLGRDSDAWGGFTISVDQHWWAHKCAKPTWLYVVGVARRNLPRVEIPFTQPTHCIDDGARFKGIDMALRMKPLPKSEREKTPPLFADWLCEIARRAGGYQNPVDQQPVGISASIGGELGNCSIGGAVNLPLAAEAPSFDFVSPHFKADVHDRVPLVAPAYAK